MLACCKVRRFTLRLAMAELYSTHRFTVDRPEQALFALCADSIEGLSRHKARLAITAGLVSVAGQVALDPQSQPAVQAKIEVDLRQGIPSAGMQKHQRKGGSRGSAGRAFDVLYQDDDVIVVDKAVGILAAPIDKESRGHVLELLRERSRKQGKNLAYLGQVHRIDAATSGCLLVALNKNAQSILGTQFSTHCAGRTYRALVYGGPQKDADSLTMKLGHAPNGKRWIVRDNLPGKDAVTHFEVLKRYDGYSDVRCRLETGRTHQLRIHLAAIGCPIVGDEVYGPQVGKRSKDSEQSHRRLKVNRMMLHAHTLHFDHPKTGKRIEVEAPMPAVYKTFLR